MTEESPSLYENPFRLRRKNGGFAWIVPRGETLRDEQEKKTALTLSTHIDVTELKEIEDFFIEKEQFRKTLLSVRDRALPPTTKGV